jgi:hypothetical protein
MMLHDSMHFYKIKDFCWIYRLSAVFVCVLLFVDTTITFLAVPVLHFIFEELQWPEPRDRIFISDPGSDKKEE